MRDDFYFRARAGLTAIRYRLGKSRVANSAAYDKGVWMSKQSMREEAERLIREAMERKALVIKEGKTRIEATCGKCAAANRFSAPRGTTRAAFVCKQCGLSQETL